jgi:hypothetical protein
LAPSSLADVSEKTSRWLFVLVWLRARRRQVRELFRRARRVRARRAANSVALAAPELP